MPTLAPLVLVLASVAGLLLIPFGLPGLWVIVLGIIGYGWLTDFANVSGVLIAAAIGLASLGEIGGLTGAVVGVPVPVIGSVIGGFVGAFVGAALFEYTRARRSDVAARAGWGAVLGRAAAAAVKMAIGIVLSVAALWIALRG